MKWLGWISLLGMTSLVMHAGVLTSNLLTNPGAETGDLTGWSSAGGADVDNGTFDPGINPFDGTYDFSGGLGGSSSSSLSQLVSIVTGPVTTTLIDTGTLFADVSFWEQSLNQGNPSDEAFIQLTFLDGTLTPIGSPVDTTAEYSLGSWTNITDDFAIPVGTRSISYVMEFQLEQGINIDSFVDDNSLEISDSQVSATPEPATFGVMLAGIGALGLGVLRRKRQL